MLHLFLIIYAIEIYMPIIFKAFIGVGAIGLFGVMLFLLMHGCDDAW